jgi:hypothetical protein
MHPFRFRFLLASLVLMLALAPLTLENTSLDLVFVSAITLVILSGVFSMRRERLLLLLALLLAVPSLLARWVAVLYPSVGTPLAAALVPIFFFVFFIVFVLRSVVSAERASGDVVAGALSVYLLIGFAWSLAYQGLSIVDPAALRADTAIAPEGRLDRMDLLYFSFITLATVGYGDITAVAPGAQFLAYAEAVTGVLYVAVLVARIVSVYQR